MNKICFLSFLLILFACSQDHTLEDNKSEKIIETQNNETIIKTDREKIEETNEMELEKNNSVKNHSISSNVDNPAKKDIDLVKEKANKVIKTSISLKELPSFYFKTRNATYNSCKNKDNEYMYVLYIKDVDNSGTLNFHDGNQKYILSYEGISKEGDKYIFHTKPIAEFRNVPMNVQLVLAGDDLTVTFLNKKTSTTLDKQTFVTEKGTQKYEVSECN